MKHASHVVVPAPTFAFGRAKKISPLKTTITDVQFLVGAMCRGKAFYLIMSARRSSSLLLQMIRNLPRELFWGCRGGLIDIGGCITPFHDPGGGRRTVGYVYNQLNNNQKDLEFFSFREFGMLNFSFTTDVAECPISIENRWPPLIIAFHPKTPCFLLILYMTLFLMKIYFCPETSAPTVTKLVQERRLLWWTIPGRGTQQRGHHQADGQGSRSGSSGSRCSPWKNSLGYPNGQSLGWFFSWHPWVYRMIL